MKKFCLFLLILPLLINLAGCKSNMSEPSLGYEPPMRLGGMVDEASRGNISGVQRELDVVLGGPRGECDQIPVGEDGNDKYAFMQTLPETDKLGERKSFWATNYYTRVVPNRNSHMKSLFKPLYNMNEKAIRHPKTHELTALSQEHWCSAVLEGSVRVKFKDGSELPLSFAGTGGRVANGCKKSSWEKVKFKITDSKWGKGYNRKVSLVPYRTIAVDQRQSFVPYGTVVFIPAMKGKRVSIGGRSFVHDGYFMAGDTGGADTIKGKHVDIFTGGDTEPDVDFIKSEDRGRQNPVMQVVKDPEIVARIRAMHGLKYK